MKALNDSDIPSVVYYLRPLHQQVAYRGFPADPSGFANGELVSGRVFSILTHSYLKTEGTQRTPETLFSNSSKFDRNT